MDLSPPGLGLFVDLIRPQAIDGFLTPDFQAFELNGVCVCVSLSLCVCLCVFVCLCMLPTARLRE